MCVMMGTIFSFPFRKNKPTPHLLAVQVSDIEGGGKVDFKFGVSRWEGNKAIVMYQPHYPGFGKMMKIMGDLMSGKMGQTYQDKNGDTSEWGDDLHVEVCQKWTAKGDGPYSVIFDGSPKQSIEGDEIEFEILPGCLPFYTKAK